MSNISVWEAPNGLLRIPVSGDPELTSGMVAAVLKKAPRTVSKALDSGNIQGGSRLQTGEKPGDRRLRLSSMIEHMKKQGLPIANLLAMIGGLTAARQKEHRRALSEILPLGVLFLSTRTELRDQIHRFLVEFRGQTVVHLEYHGGYESFRQSPGLFLPVFAILDGDLGREIVANVAAVMRARACQLGVQFPVIVIAWEAHQEADLQVEGVQIFSMANGEGILPRLPQLLAGSPNGVLKLVSA